MRTTYLLLAGALLLPGAGAVLLATRGGDKNAAMNADLKKDLELASSTDGITLANSSGDVAMQVVSAIERTTPPTRQQTPSTRVRRHRAAPKAPPQVVRAEAPASVNETELQSVSPEPVAYDPTPVSPRPQPVAVSYPSGPSSGGDDGRVSTGSTTGAVIGSILGAVLNGHAVIRGGAVGDVDRCDPRTDGRRTRGGISSSQRFPLPGRVSGTNRSGGISIGGVAIGRPPRF